MHNTRTAGMFAAKGDTGISVTRDATLFTIAVYRLPQTIAEHRLYSSVFSGAEVALLMQISKARECLVRAFRLAADATAQDCHYPPAEYRHDQQGRQTKHDTDVWIE